MEEQDVDMMAIGRHCRVSHCRRLDFLPFTCRHCNEMFCLEHRMPDEHECQEVKEKDIYVPICPVCGELIKRSKGEDTNDQVEKHLLSGCKDLIVKKSKKTNKCSMRSCRQNEIMPFYCDKCGKRFCVRHRHAQDHLCTTLNVPLIACS